MYNESLVTGYQLSIAFDVRSNTPTMIGWTQFCVPVNMVQGAVNSCSDGT